jgi:hypothetical protein
MNTGAYALVIGLLCHKKCGCEFRWNQMNQNRKDKKDKRQKNQTTGRGMLLKPELPDNRP